MNNIRDWMHSVQIIVALSSGLMSSLPVLAQPAEIRDMHVNNGLANRASTPFDKLRTSPLSPRGIRLKTDTLFSGVSLSQSQHRQVDGLSKNAIFAAPPPPTDYGEPGRRSSAGSRNCSATSTQATPLTALAPTDRAGDKNVVGGLTTKLNPTFWFYVPVQLSSEDTVELVLKDAEDNYIYQTQHPGSANAQGIVHLSLPANIALDANQSYRWHFLLYCNSSSPSHFVSGFIQRVNRPELDQQLTSATPREQVTLYAEAGLWYDALTTLAKLYRQNPQDQSLSQTWAQLLQDIQLKSLAQEPFSTCCTSDR